MDRLPRVFRRGGFEVAALSLYGRDDCLMKVNGVFCDVKEGIVAGLCWRGDLFFMEQVTVFAKRSRGPCKEHKGDKEQKDPAHQKDPDIWKIGKSLCL